MFSAMQLVSALRYSPVPADLARLIASWRQPEVGSCARRPAERAAGCDNRQRGDRSHARSRHQKAHRRMPLGNRVDLAVEGSDSGKDVAAGLCQSLDDRDKLRRNLSSCEMIPSVRRLKPPIRLPNMTPNVFKSPRISFSSLMRMPTKASRAVSSARCTKASWLLICAALNQPGRTIWARPRASWRSVLRASSSAPHSHDVH